MNHELHRPIRIDRIAPSSLRIEVVATDQELPALAARLQIPAVLSLRCEFILRPEPKDAFAAAGHLKARVVQNCVVTLDDFEADIEERFAVRFVPAGTETDDIDLEADDEIPYEGDVIDLGEAAAEQLALGLDPYPKKPGAVLPAEADEDSANPFAVLKRIKS